MPTQKKLELDKLSDRPAQTKYSDLLEGNTICTFDNYLENPLTILGFTFSPIAFYVLSLRMKKSISHKSGQRPVQFIKSFLPYIKRFAVFMGFFLCTNIWSKKV